MHRMRELQSVHAARHLNVRKKQRDVGTRFENGERLLGVDRFDSRESGVLDNIDRAHSQHHLVFDDEHLRFRVDGIQHEMPAFQRRNPNDRFVANCSMATERERQASPAFHLLPRQRLRLWALSRRSSWRASAAPIWKPRSALLFQPRPLHRISSILCQLRTLFGFVMKPGPGHGRFVDHLTGVGCAISNTARTVGRSLYPSSRTQSFSCW